MSNKMKVEWYEENLKNSTEYANMLKKEVTALQSKISHLEETNEFSAHQISEAKRQGKTEYDCDKFCIKKGGK